MRSAQKAYSIKEPPLTSDQIKPADILNKYPKKIRMKDKSLLDTELKGMAIKKKKESPYHKHSKRTTPGTVEGRNSTPAHVKPESTRWVNNLNKQSRAKRTQMTRQTLKRK